MPSPSVPSGEHLGPDLQLTSAPTPTTLSIVIPVSPTESMEGVKKTLYYIQKNRTDDKRVVEVILSMPSNALIRDAMTRELEEAKGNTKYLTKIVTYDDHNNTGGRGKCQNVGLHAARGTVVLFCHCDAILPVGYDASVARAFDDDDNHGRKRVAMTYFHLKLDTSSSSSRPGFQSQFPARSANARCRAFGFPYGDQGLAFRREDLVGASSSSENSPSSSAAARYEGGFRNDLKIMEDFELVRRVRFCVRMPFPLAVD